MEEEKIKKLFKTYSIYLKSQISLYAEIILSCNSIEASNNNSIYSRSKRRLLQKENGRNKKYNHIRSLSTNAVNFLSKIFCICIEKNDKLDPIDERNFSVLIQSIVGFYLSIIKNENDFKEEKNIIAELGENCVLQIFEYFIKISNKNANSSIYNCFNNDGTLNIDHVFDFKYIIHNMSKDWCITDAGLVKTKLSTEFDVESIFINAINLEEARERQKYLESLNKKDKVDINNSIFKIKTKIEEKKEIKYTKKEKSIYSKYINPISLSLRKDVVDLVSYEELEKILLELPNMNKAKLNEYKINYINMYVDKKISEVIKLDEQNCKLLKNLLLNNSARTYKDLYELIYDKNYNEDELNDILIQYINKYKKVENKQIKNLIIFPDAEFILNELSDLSKMPSCKDKTPLINHIFKSLEILKNQSYQSLIDNNSDSFHRLKVGNSQDFILRGCKGYRFGAKKSKIALFRLSISFENQEILKKQYNLDYSFNVYLIFGFGNVLIEEEEKLYRRLIKNAYSIEEEIEYIKSIFSNPFTNETLQEAIDYIDNSSLQIDNIDDTVKVLTKI